MRAVCEACSRPQPVDWQPGQFCVECGQSVSPQVRCFWCAKWTPAGKFCRECSAALVDPALYGTARMLKSAGSDMFTIPRQLVEMDPDQRENFARRYQRQEAVVLRHVEDLRFIEQWLFLKHWSRQLDDDLIPKLPMSPDAIQGLAVEGPPPARFADPEDPNAARELGRIMAHSPFSQTQILAGCARLHFGEWEAIPTVRQGLAYRADLGLECALALTGWRVIYEHGIDSYDRQPLAQNLRDSSLFPVHTATRLFFVEHRGSTIPEEALSSSDRELRFLAALGAQDVGQLAEALREPGPRRRAAAGVLASAGAFDHLGPIIRDLTGLDRAYLLKNIQLSRKPVDTLRDVLTEVAETGAPREVSIALQLLSRCDRFPATPRLVGKALEERGDTQTLLQAKNLEAGDLVTIVDRLLANGRFTLNQFGLKDCAEPGRLPDDFVPRRFETADLETKCEMLRFVEEQIERRQRASGPVDELWTFVTRVSFGPYPAKVIDGAWWVLKRLIQQRSYQEIAPLTLSTIEIEKYFGSLEAFLPKFTALLTDLPRLRELNDWQTLAKMLRYSEDFVPALAKSSRGAKEFIAALFGVMHDPDAGTSVHSDFLGVLAEIAIAAPEHRQTIVQGLSRLDVYPIDFHARKAVERIEQESA